MALIVCPECNRNISDRAAACPHCGYPVMDGEGGIPSKKRSCVSDTYFVRLWQGKYPLRYTFWGSFFSVYIAINILIAVFPEMLLRIILPPMSHTMAIITACYLAYAIYLLICAVGVWRAAARYPGHRGLAIAARFFVCSYTVSSLYMITSGFMLPLLNLYKQLH